MARTIIKGGAIVDGTGSSRYRADVLIVGCRIRDIRSNIDPMEDDDVIDAAGLVVSPGFIDTHSHSDLRVLVEPEVLPKVMQGITTEILGQDGVSMAPLPTRYIDTWRKNLAGLDGDSDDIKWDYVDTEHYLDMIEEVSPGINEGYLLPHGNVRMEAMGLEDRLATPDELELMCEITERELDAGAFGLSTGLIYLPCAYAPTEELVELCRVVARHEGVFVTHQRSEADVIIESMHEIVRIGMESGVRTHFSHFKVCGKKNWGYVDDMLAILDKAKADGLQLSFDQYPYVAGSTMMGACLPPWVYDGGTDKALARLADAQMRERMVRDIKNGITGWDNFIDFAGFDNIYCTSVKTPANADAVGLSLVELAEKRGIDPYDALFDLLLQEENAVGMVDFYGLEDHLRLFMARPEMNACTDGLLGGRPHPRVYGAFPRILGKYVREERVMSLEEGVNRLTKRAADHYGIKNRGVLEPGNYADVCVFDPDRIIDKGTFTDPVQYPEGINHVLVNGVVAVRDGEPTHERNGMVLRKNRQ